MKTNASATRANETRTSEMNAESKQNECSLYELAYGQVLHSFKCNPRAKPSPLQVNSDFTAIKHGKEKYQHPDVPELGGGHN